MIGLLPGLRVMTDDELDLPMRMRGHQKEVFPDDVMTKLNTEPYDVYHRWRETDTEAIEELVQEVRRIPKPPDVAKHMSLIERELARLRDPNYTGVVDNAVGRKDP